MTLIRTVRLSRDLRLPNGALVKIEIDETAHAQHVHDQFDRTHATARPDPIVFALQRQGRLGTLREDRRATNGGHKFATDDDLNLWVPLPADVTALRQDGTAYPASVAMRGGR